MYEKSLQALPTMATVLAYPWGWLYRADTGITRSKHVLAAQGIKLHRTLPVKGHVTANLRVTNVIDKGATKGALVYTEREIYDGDSGDPLCSVSTTMFCRADGGFGGPSSPVPSPVAIPDEAPDLACDLPTLPQAPLIYRLCGDRNPLHVDPDVARGAGFRGPILHGLCTFGVVGHALLRSCCNYEPSRIKAMEARFSAPVYGGETIRTEIWKHGTRVIFRALSAERNTIVLNHGVAEIHN